MLFKFCRKYVGGIRLAMTLLVVIFGFVVVMIDLICGKNFSAQAYTFLGGMLAVVAVFVWKDTERPAGAERMRGEDETVNYDM